MIRGVSKQVPIAIPKTCSIRSLASIAVCATWFSTCSEEERTSPKPPYGSACETSMSNGGTSRNHIVGTSGIVDSLHRPRWRLLGKLHLHVWTNCLVFLNLRSELLDDLLLDKWLIVRGFAPVIVLEVHNCRISRRSVQSHLNRLPLKRCSHRSLLTAKSLFILLPRRCSA